MIDYYLMRGHAWADNTSIQEALEFVDDVAIYLPELSGELRAYLTRRARRDGHGFSVADVGRVQWYRRRCNAWADICEPDQIWSGGDSWQMLRIRHLHDQGWGHREIADTLRLRPRLIRERVAAAGFDQTVAGW